jgi:hypothetical protein
MFSNLCYREMTVVSQRGQLGQQEYFENTSSLNAWSIVVEELIRLPQGLFGLFRISCREFVHLKSRLELNFTGFFLSVGHER